MVNVVMSLPPMQVVTFCPFQVPTIGLTHPAKTNGATTSARARLSKLIGKLLFQR
jgi:hypothetical protein